ncbi:uncharacterized protein EI90DRAFT_833088 [Cantharellus anzutake]|uniref:uncharacterized protein n=1 Tax=Cantharellus anzutake TaxID=1750568 RepID=UPI0019075698|nr:uncharacterized protein EI90DRAFT_833088 [Cantharellus anzutake]KAF8343139.1 hypothetical protein EI90DRAFT_833088 [Cantharellus anzutake]
MSPSTMPLLHDDAAYADWQKRAPKQNCHPPTMDSSPQCGDHPIIENEPTLRFFAESFNFQLSSDLIGVDPLEGACPRADSLSGAIGYLKKLRNHWSAGKLELPSNWMLEQPIISLLREGKPFLSQLMIGVTLAPIQHMLSSLTPEEVDLRYDSPTDLRPDFLLSTARVFLQPHWTADERDRQLFGYLNRDTRYASSQLHSLLMHNGGDPSTGDMLMYALSGSPGSWVLRNPRLCFPAEFQPSQSPDRIRFCVVRHLITPLMAESKRLDQYLPVSFSNPALITGAFDPGDESVSSETLENVFHVVRGSLASLVLASFYRRRITSHGSGFWSKGSKDRLLPEFLMVFSLICQPHHLRLLAFVPFWDEASGKYLVASSEVDTFRFGEYPPEEDQTEELMTGPNSPYLERVRLFLALKAISKHAFRLCDIFDTSMSWPPLDVCEMEQKWRLLYLPEDERTEALDDTSHFDIEEAEAYAQEEAEELDGEGMYGRSSDSDSDNTFVSTTTETDPSLAHPPVDTTRIETWLGAMSTKASELSEGPQ